MSVRVRTVPQELNTASSSWPKVKKVQLKSSKSSSSGSTRLRPDTATLEKPLMLDPGLIRKLDMTRTTRERLITIENLVATPKKIKGKSRVKEKTTVLSPKINRKDLKVTEDSWEDDSSTSEEPKLRKLSRALNTTFRIRTHTRKSLKEVFTPSPLHLQVPGSNVSDAEHGGKSRSKSRSPVPRSKNNSDGFGDVIELVPSPCCTCGRKEQPERLHAHPKRATNKKNKSKDDQENKEVNQQQKNSVTKPVPMKFRSGKTRGKIIDQTSSPDVDTKKEVSLIRSETFKIERSDSRNLPIVDKKASPTASPFRRTVNKIRRSPVPARSPEIRRTDEEGLGIPLLKNPVVHSASSLRRPRSIVCYLCSKQFFTTSFPLHETHCLQFADDTTPNLQADSVQRLEQKAFIQVNATGQYLCKWQRENAELPAHLQMPLPEKPDVPLTSDEWNQFAWEAAQAVLVPCENCNRTFLPARLEAHLRACTQAHSVKKSCAKRQVQDWDSDREDKSERSDRSEHITGPPTVHCHICGRMFTNASINIHEEHCLKRWQQENQSSEESTKRSPASSPMSSPAHSTQSSAQSTPRRRFVICYICGRQFGSKSIDIHEPQCMRKWHLENDKLPSSQRRQEPRKPDPVYDIGATSHHPQTALARTSSQPSRTYRCVVSFINGGQFGTTSITIKVPQRPQVSLSPKRPSLTPRNKGKVMHGGFVFDIETGKVDIEATAEAQWQTHLVQLIPCGKCGRTFNPDRVTVHERCCKGPINKH